MVSAFRMWGSYIGTVMGIIVGFFMYSAIKVICEFGACKPGAYVLPIIPVVIGFIVGWGTHLLIRKLRK